MQIWQHRQTATRLFFVVSLFVACHARLLALDPNKTLTQDVHRIWGQEEGLFQPTIYSILQTRNGFLWLGTQDSLIRFDGVHFREFDGAAQSGLERSLIRGLLEDTQGNLWVGSIGSGVVRINPDGSFRRFGAKDGLPGDSAFCLSSGRQGSVWVCNNEGLARFEGGRFRLFTTADGLPTNRVRDSCEAADGTRWVAGVDFELARSKGERFEAYSDPQIPPRETVTALACGRDGSVWVGKSNGVTRIMPGHPARSFTVRDGLPDNQVSALYESPDGALWIGTNDGITRYRNSEFSVYRTRDGLSHSLVLALYSDREGSLWAGTKDGLDQFTDGKVTPYSTNEGMPTNEVGPLVEDKAGRLWIGTLGRGLSVFDGHRFRGITTQNGLQDNTVLSLAVDSAGDLWAGTRHGVNRLHNGMVAASYTTRDGLSGLSVNVLFVDAQGTLWAGTDKGLNRFEDGRFKKSAWGTAADKGAIVALGGGRTVRLFASSDEPSLSVFANGTAQNYPLDISRPVDSYYLDQVRHMGWFGTLGSGLVRWKNGATVHIRVKDGLYDNRIYAILRDDSDNFWMASSKGIFRVSEQELEDFADGKIHYVTSIPFTTGQLHFECRAGVQPAACRTRDGRLWFATTNGLVVVDPNRLVSNITEPPVQITAMVINGQRTGPAPGVHLSPTERNLEIRYAGLSFVSPEKVTFRYLLEGFEKAWTEAGTRREAVFTNLPPGHYRFRVVARNADGVWSRDAASLDFAADPRLYQRRWFFPLLALLLASIVVFWYRLRIQRLKQRFDLVLAERSRIARELHDTLLQGLSGITMQLQALWTRLPHSKEKNQLREIIQDAARCSAEARQSLWGLRVMPTGSADFGQKLTSLVQAATADERIVVSLEIEQISLAAFPEAEYQLLRIAREAVMNSLRHARARRLEVRLRSTAKQVELTICDDGAGFDTERSELGHFGVLGMRERAAEIGAEFSIVSGPQQGTSVSVTLPLTRPLPGVSATGSNADQPVEHQIS